MRWFRLCRVPILLLILVMIAAAEKAAQSKGANSSKSSAGKSGQKQQVRQGYSIFRDTLVEMPWPEIKKAAEADALVLLPVAVIEEHGPHMGLGADTYLSHEGCRILKRRLEAQNVKVVIVPPVYWGVMQTQETGAYPGSFTVQPSTMKALLIDVLTDLKRWGFKHVYPINFHGDRVHRETFMAAMDEARQTLGLDIYDMKVHGFPRTTIPEYKVPNPYQPDYHAGAQETAEMLKYFPEEVNLQTAKTLKPESTFHPLGYVGDPANYANANSTIEGFLEPVTESITKWLKDGEKKNP